MVPPTKWKFSTCSSRADPTGRNLALAGNRPLILEQIIQPHVVLLQGDGDNAGKSAKKARVEDEAAEMARVAAEAAVKTSDKPEAAEKALVEAEAAEMARVETDAAERDYEGAEVAGNDLVNVGDAFQHNQKRQRSDKGVINGAIPWADLSDNGQRGMDLLIEAVERRRLNSSGVTQGGSGTTYGNSQKKKVRFHYTMMGGLSGSLQANNGKKTAAALKVLVFTHAFLTSGNHDDSNGSVMYTKLLNK